VLFFVSTVFPLRRAQSGSRSPLARSFVDIVENASRCQRRLGHHIDITEFTLRQLPRIVIKPLSDPIATQRYLALN